MIERLCIAAHREIIQSEAYPMGEHWMVDLSVELDHAVKVIRHRTRDHDPLRVGQNIVDDITEMLVEVVEVCKTRGKGKRLTAADIRSIKKGMAELYLGKGGRSRKGVHPRAS